MDAEPVAVDQMTPSDQSAVQPHLGAEAPARVKVLNPMTSMGRSMRAEVLRHSDMDLQVRVPRDILVGSIVQVRTSQMIAFGEVRSATPAGAVFDIGVAVQRSA
jgi:hypothetical protein